MSGTETPDPDFEALLEFIRDQRGFDFTGYKRPSLTRRVNKRMETIGVNSYRDYQDILEAQPEEFGELFNTILINVTSFFRDAEAWDHLSSQVIPELLARKDPGAPIRVWVPGCASGEEAYSVIMLLAEALGVEETRDRVKVYATDVDEDALASARQSTFTARQMEPVPEHLRSKYFEQTDDRYVLRADLRRSVIFGRHNLVHDAPISRIDLLICRNTMMYFNAETQSHILGHFHFALQPHGLLFLGRGEMMLARSGLFTPIDIQNRIFAKIPDDQLEQPRRQPFTLTDGPPSNETRSEAMETPDLHLSALEASPVAQLAVDASGTLTLANELARVLFALAPEDVGRPLRDLQISYRPVELRSLVEQMQTDGQPVVRKDIRWDLSPQDIRYLNLYISPLRSEGRITGAVITFTDVTEYRQTQEDLERSRQDLETANEELESTSEELETTNEELQSTNEELETTNEELQSANEELETTNEELQSSNEELDVINVELRERSTELAEANLFLESILDSLRLGLVVLDTDYRIEIWNNWATEFWGLRADEVEGKHFMSLDFGLPVDQLRDGINDCLAGRTTVSKLDVEATNRRGRQITCRLVMMPRHRFDEQIHGIIILMEDISNSEADA